MRCTSLAHRRRPARRIGAADSRATKSEPHSVSHKIHQIDVDDPASHLEQAVHRHDVFRVVVPNRLQRTVFAIFGFAARENGIGNLDVAIGHVRASQDKIAFELADSPDADFVMQAPSI